MPAPSSINPLLPGGAQPTHSRPSARGDGGGDFRQLVEDRSAPQSRSGSSSERSAGSPDGASKASQSAARRSESGEDGERSVERQAAPSARSPDTGRENADTSSSSKAEKIAGELSLRQGRQEASGDGQVSEAVLKEAKALLESLSDGEQGALVEDIAAVLEQLKARSEAGELNPQTEEALEKVLAQLEEGADLDSLMSSLEQVPLDGMPQLAERFAQARNLAEALGRRGAAYLTALTARAGEQTADGGKGPDLPARGEPRALDLTSLAQAQPAVKNERSDPQASFELLLDKMRAPEPGQRADTPSRSVTDLRHNAVAADQLARTDAAGRSSAELTQTVPGQSESQARSQPLAPGERQFTVQSEVRVPVGQSQWGEAVGKRIAWMASQRLSSAELHLDPPDLGPLQVKVSNSSQDQISVTFTSAQPAVREALDQNAARLREMFADQGLDLVDVNVSDHPDTGEQGDDDPEAGTGRGFADGAEDESDASATTRIVTDRLVDHYA